MEFHDVFSKIRSFYPIKITLPNILYQCNEILITLYQCIASALFFRVFINLLLRGDHSIQKCLTTFYSGEPAWNIMNRTHLVIRFANYYFELLELV